MRDQVVSDYIEAGPVTVTFTVEALTRDLAWETAIRIDNAVHEAPEAVKTRPDWDTYFLGIARAVSERSDCDRDKVGAVLVKDRRIRSSGYNGAPAGAPGCEHCPRRTSDSAPGSSYDNCVAIHAEGNCLLYADREDLIDATLYITREPCYACSKLIAGAGVIRVVTPDSYDVRPPGADELLSVDYDEPTGDCYYCAKLGDGGKCSDCRVDAGEDIY